MVFIIFGSKLIHRKKGYVADFCTICRGARPFVLYKVLEVGHVYYMHLGFGKLVAHLAGCMDCGLKVETDADTYRQVQKEKPTDINLLIEKTYPELAQRWAERLEIERQIQNGQGGKLDPELRLNLMMECFDVLEPWFLNQYEETKLDKTARNGCLGMFTVMALLIFLVGGVLPDNLFGNIVALILLVMFGLSVVYATFNFFTIRGRRNKTWFIPVLAKALGPLQPTQAEVAKLMNVKIQQSRRYKKLSLDSLLTHLGSPNQQMPFDQRLCKSPADLR